MKHKTINTNFPYNSHQIKAQSEENQYKLVVSPKDVLSVRIMTEDGWKAMVSVPEEAKELAEKYRQEEMK